MKAKGKNELGRQSRVPGCELTTRSPKTESRNPNSEIRSLKSAIRTWAAGIGVLLTLSAVGCGYQFSGSGEGLPQDVRSVFVEPFINRSREVGIEREIASALKSEFHHQGRLRVADRPERADAVLTGVVRSLESRVVAVNRKDEVLQFETALVVDVSLRRRNPDQVLWRTEGTRLVELHAGSRAAVVTSSADFKTGTLNASDLRPDRPSPFTDVQLTETLLSQAREKLAERFARELHQRIMDMF